MTALSERVCVAQGDVGQAEGRLRERYGGGALELPGIRLMASGLPHAKWNNADVSDPELADLAAARAWYESRGVPWGVRVPCGAPFPHGRFLFTQRCMGLEPASFRTVELPPRVSLRLGGPTDAALVTEIDAEAFGDTVEENRPFIEPRLGAPGFTTAVAELDGEPVGIATAVDTDGRGGPAVGLYGVAVRERARRRGIGGAICSWLLERGFCEGATLAHVNPDTAEAGSLYAGLGFVETAGFDIHVEL